VTVVNRHPSPRGWLIWPRPPARHVQLVTPTGPR
jgi:hypothetical protein